MDRIRWITQKGKQVLLEDFSGIKPGEEYLKLIESAANIIHGQSPKSVRTLFDASGAMFDTEAIEALKSFTASNKPYVLCAAVVGVEGLLGIALNVVSKFSGRDFKTFKTREEALDWLVQH